MSQCIICSVIISLKALVHSTYTISYGVYLPSPAMGVKALPLLQKKRKEKGTEQSSLDQGHDTWGALDQDCRRSILNECDFFFKQKSDWIKHSYGW